jgi:hypothetical protein
MPPAQVRSSPSHWWMVEHTGSHAMPDKPTILYFCCYLYRHWFYSTHPIILMKPMPPGEMITLKSLTNCCGTNKFTRTIAWQERNHLHTVTDTRINHLDKTNLIMPLVERQSSPSHWKMVVEQTSLHALQPDKRENCLHAVTGNGIVSTRETHLQAFPLFSCSYCGARNSRIMQHWDVSWFPQCLVTVTACCPM